MEKADLWQIELIPWYAFCAYWLITWLRVKRAKTSEPWTSRLLLIVPMALAFDLLFSTGLRIGPLGWRFVPVDARIGWAGVVLTGVGVAIAIWARYSIGQNWSARVMLKEGHQLIRSGPYARVRHPIYTGLLLAVIGTSLVVGEWRAVVAVFLVLVSHSRKAKREEALLTTEFGDEYCAYRRSTGFLFPRLRTTAGMDTHPQGS